LRWLTILAGTALVILAFAAATRVADTREGLVAEVVTLLAGLGGVLLLIYGLTARRRPADRPQAPAASVPAARRRGRSARDLALGAGGITLAAILFTGLAVSGGPMWAGLGLLLMVPMLAGSLYLCVRFLRSEP
jgi:hypothetical protein